MKTHLLAVLTLGMLATPSALANSLHYLVTTPAAACLAQAKDGGPATLDTLGRNGGARFGEWKVWRHDGKERALLLIHDRTGAVLYLLWSSNGWIDYRNGKGVWETVYTLGANTPKAEAPVPLEKFAGVDPGRDLGTGVHRFLKWTATVNDDQISLFSAESKSAIIVKKNSGVFSSNGRNFGEEGGKKPPPPPKPGKTAKLDSVKDGVNLRFGDWSIWRFTGKETDMLMVNQKAGYTIHFMWNSNGYVNFRNPRGEWWAIYSKGPLMALGAYEKVDDYLKRKPPEVDVATGNYKLPRWNVRVLEDRIEFDGIDFGDRFIVRRDSGVFVHNDRKFGE